MNPDIDSRLIQVEVSGLQNDQQPSVPAYIIFAFCHLNMH